MPNYIIKIKDKYFEWSTIVDAPITNSMTIEELERYISVSQGDEGIRKLPERMVRVNAKGCSSLRDDLGALLESNRAGENETSITAEEIYERYRY